MRDVEQVMGYMNLGLSDKSSVEDINLRNIWGQIKLKTGKFTQNLNAGDKMMPESHVLLT